MNTLSPLQQARLTFQPRLPFILRDLCNLEISKGEATLPLADAEALKKLFPLTLGQPLVHFKKEGVKKHPAKKVGVVLSGGQAAGGHNVITGLFDALKCLNPKSQLYGFIGGPSGIVNSEFRELTEEVLAAYRNQGGFDLIGSGRTKIETEEQLKASLASVNKLELDGLVVVGGDDSNTNAAILAEYFKSQGSKTQVIGVPKTIDGDLKNAYIEVSFGFDTACKVYSELIGNILRDCLSSKKYYHFIKLMGRSASHIALECALQTRPNVTLIGEEIAAQKLTLMEVTKFIADVICMRAEQGKNYGAILIPEGLIEFIPEVGSLIAELNTLLSHREVVTLMEGLTTAQERIGYIVKQLSQPSSKCFLGLPEKIAEQLLFDRDPHGNVQVSRIETEQLFMEMVRLELKKRKELKHYKGSFSAQHHFFGYEGRAAFPSNFDSQYCYALGFVAALLIQQGLTGYMSSVQNLSAPVEQWTIMGAPITMMMNLEKRHGKDKPVIRKALVELQGRAFKAFAEQRKVWAVEDQFCFPGPIQFFGDATLTDTVPLSMF